LKTVNSVSTGPSQQ